MEDKALYVFDMDDTLLSVPKLTSFIDIENGEIKTENDNAKEYVNKIKGIFLTLFSKELCFEKNNDSVVILDCRTNKPIETKYLDFIQDLTPEKIASAGLKNSVKKDLLRAIEQEGELLTLEPFPGFYDTKETIGDAKKEDICAKYKLAKNKMIISGRNEKMREDILKKFNEIGIEPPNFGLYLFPGGNKGIADFKVKTIKDSIINNGWRTIHFFEDRKDWLDKAYFEIKEQFPTINFIKHLIEK